MSTRAARRAAEMPPGVEKLGYTVAETAAALGLGHDLTRQLIYSGQMPCIRVGRAIIVPRHCIERFVRDHSGAWADLATRVPVSAHALRVGTMQSAATTDTATERPDDKNTAATPAGRE